MTVEDRQAQARQHKERGTGYFTRGKPEAALKEFRKALLAVPNDAAARRKAAELEAKLGRKKEAIADYQHLAGQFAAQGQMVQAIALCKVILQLDPAHAQTQEVLAGLSRRSDPPEGRFGMLPRAMSGAFAVPQELPTLPVLEMPEELEVEIITGVELGPDDVEIDLSGLSGLSATPLFGGLPQEIFNALLSRVELLKVPQGSQVVTEGSVGHSLFAIAGGSVQVFRHVNGGRPKQVAEMREGEFFGEIALVANVPRLATVVAGPDCELLEISREVLAELSARFPELEQVVQHFYKERLLANVLRSSEALAMLSEQERTALVDRFVLRNVPSGEILLTRGQQAGGFFLILRGSCEAFHPAAQGREHHYPVMDEGATFGEISLIHGGAVTATVRSRTPCLLLVVDEPGFRSHLMRHPEVSRHLAALGAERLARTVRLLESGVGAAFI